MKWQQWTAVLLSLELINTGKLDTEKALHVVPSALSLKVELLVLVSLNLPQKPFSLDSVLKGFLRMQVYCANNPANIYRSHI